MRARLARAVLVAMFGSPELGVDAPRLNDPLYEKREQERLEALSGGGVVARRRAETKRLRRARLRFNHEYTARVGRQSSREALAEHEHERQRRADRRRRGAL